MLPLPLSFALGGGMPRIILLVEHTPALRTVVRLHLGRNGGSSEFIEAVDVTAALSAMRQRDVHLVIADVRSGAHGRALVAALRGGEPAKDRPVPIVVVAARPSRELRDAVARAGACALVHKPVTAARLRAAIDSLLSAKP